MNRPARFPLLGILPLLPRCFGALNAAAGNPFVHPLFTSHMVLQRDADDPVWGWTTPGVTVTVKVFDQNAALLQTETAVADSNGRWQTTVGPFGLVPNNAPYSLTISAPGQTTVTLTDVLIGDVWLCSGQSNMDWSVSGVYNATAEIADSVNYPNVRCFTVPQVTSLTAQSNISGGSWIVSAPATTGGFTAVGYFMAREIYKQQGIPIGILRSSWGGTIIEAWSDPAFVAGIADFTQEVFDQSMQTPYNNTVSGLYQAMINPLAPFRIKAVNWYQGEFNAGVPEQYGRILPGLMSSWRALFGQPHLPFVIVQLPNADPAEGSNWAELREAQAKTVANDPDSRLVVTLDIGGGVLHPLDKQDVGLRSAWAAANLVYGKSIVDQAPAFAGFSVSGTNLTCTFTNVGGGLMVGSKNYTNPITPTQPVLGGTVKGFLLAGANQVFYSANAMIASSNTIVVSSPSVAQPTAVRYAWLTYPDFNLYNEITNALGLVVDGLPMGSFRSDPVNKLNVNNGSGTGDYALGARPTIVASGNPAGEVFDHWSGDTNLLASALSATTAATISQPYVSVLANYRITGAPSGLKATLQTGLVTLSWNPMTWVHYNVKRSTASADPFTTLAASLYATNSFVDTNATEGITYYYVVSATNLLGEGPNSAVVNVTTTGNAVLSRSVWVASASTSASGSPPTNAIDGDITTRWSTGAAQATGQWFQVDMGSAKTFFRIVLDAGTSSGDYPQDYQVNVSNDGVNWGSPVASGAGSAAVTTISFPSQTARYIRVTQTGTSGGWWSIHEFNVYGGVSALPTRTNYTNSLGGKWSSVIWQPNPSGQPASSTQTAILFANNPSINSTNDLGSFTLNELLFANQAVNLAGSPLVFDGTTPLVTNLQNSSFSIANALTLSQTTDFEISANITTLGGGVSGGGGLIKSGAGTLVLVGTNSYSGGTIINDGILQLGDGTTNGVVVGSIVNNSPLPGGVTFNNGAAQTNSTAISGSGSVAKSGNGTLTWGMQGAYTGLTAINGGTLINASGVNGLGVSWALVSISSNAAWVFNYTSASAGSLALTNGNCGISRSGNLNFTSIISSGTSSIGVSEMKIGADQIGGIYTALFNVTDGTLTLNVNKLWNYAGGTVNATSSVVKTGAGMVVIANLGSSYKGSTTLSGGVWQVSILANGGTDGHIGQSGSAATNLVLNGGTLKYSGAAVTIDRLFSLGTSGGTLDASGIGALTLNNLGTVGFVNSGARTLTLAGTSVGANTLAASLGDNGGPTALLKIGAGAWTLSGANSFSGGAVVSGGTLTVGASASLGSGNLSVSNGASCLIQNAAGLANGAYVYINGVLNLANSGINTVARLYIGNVLQAAGLWNAARDAVHFAGAGSLNVSGGQATGPMGLTGSALSGGGIRLTWTNSAADLYCTPNLMPPVVWVAVTNPPAWSNGQWSVTMPGGTNASGFYRLAQ
jgi:autotransporter-associated beta strand protein